MRTGERSMFQDVTDAHGTRYEPWTDGWAVGFKVTAPSGVVSYVYLHPSSESDDGVSNVFLCHGPRGDAAHDGPLCYVDVDVLQAEDGSPARAVCCECAECGFCPETANLRERDGVWLCSRCATVDPHEPPSRRADDETGHLRAAEAR